MMSTRVLQLNQTQRYQPDIKLGDPPNFIMRTLLSITSYLK